MSRPHTPAQRGSAAEAIRHLVLNLGTSLGHLIEQWGDRATQAKYAAFEAGAGDLAERLARHETVHGPVLDLHRLSLGGSLSADPHPRKR